MATQRPDTRGAWIFVSHSHLDLEKVREVRDLLEQRAAASASLQRNRTLD